MLRDSLTLVFDPVLLRDSLTLVFESVLATLLEVILLMTLRMFSSLRMHSRLDRVVVVVVPVAVVFLEGELLVDSEPLSSLREWFSPSSDNK